MGRRLLAWGLGLGAFLFLLTGPASAACPMPLIIGQWQHIGDDSRWAFFSSGKVDCRLCKTWNKDGVCVYVRDDADEQGRRQCHWAGIESLNRQSPVGKLTVTGWRAKDGIFAALEFSDGSVVDMTACKADGEKGEISLPRLGGFSCHYNYQCAKLEREAR
jgi:hypothetical protein